MNIATPKASEEDLIKAGRWAHIKPQVFNLDSMMMFVWKRSFAFNFWKFMVFWNLDACWFVFIFARQYP